MAKGEYAVVNGTTRKIKKKYAVVNGVTRKIKKEYVVVDGKTRLCWSGGGNNPLIFTHIVPGNYPAEQHSVLVNGDDVRTASFTDTELGQWELAERGAVYLIGDKYYYIAYSGGNSSASYYYSSDGKVWTKVNISIAPSGVTGQTYFEGTTYIGDGKFACIAMVSNSSSTGYCLQYIGILDVATGGITFTQVTNTYIGSGQSGSEQRGNGVFKYNDQTYYFFLATKKFSDSYGSISLYKWNGASTVTQLSSHVVRTSSVHGAITYSAIPFGDIVLMTFYNADTYLYALNLKTGAITQLLDLKTYETKLIKASDTEFIALYRGTQFRRYSFNGTTATLLSDKTNNSIYSYSNHVIRDGVLYHITASLLNGYTEFYLEYSADYGTTWTKRTVHKCTTPGSSSYSGGTAARIWNGLETEGNTMSY